MAVLLVGGRLGLVEVEMLVSVELQRCLDVMEFLLQAMLVTGAESTADQCVVDSVDDETKSCVDTGLCL